MGSGFYEGLWVSNGEYGFLGDLSSKSGTWVFHGSFEFLLSIIGF